MADRNRPVAGFLAFGLLVAACASTPAVAAALGEGTRNAGARGGPVAIVRDDASRDRDLFAATLAGRLAEESGTPAIAARAYERAWLADTGDTGLLRRAIAAWLDAGNTESALSLARQMPVASRSAEAALLLSVDALLQRRSRTVDSLLSGAILPPTERQMANALSAGALVAQRAWDEAGTRTAQASGNRGIDRVGPVIRGLVNDQAGRPEQASAAYDIAWGSGLRVPTLALLRARNQAATGDRVAALATLNEVSDPAAAALARKIASGQLPAVPVGNAAVAQSLLAIGEVLAAEPRMGSPVTALRLALMLDPTLDRARIELAADLVGKDRRDEALALLSQVPGSSPYRETAALSRAWALSDSNDNDAALQVLQSALQDGPSVRIEESIALLDLIADRHDAAAQRFSRLISRAQDAGADEAQLANWHYNRAISLDSLDRWPEAESDYRRAIALQPRNAAYLNGLGYGLADRNMRLDEAVRLLREAVRLAPRSGAIIDSLGWALYRRGEYLQAVELLERAVPLAPGSAAVVDHLGDAYWRIGREGDARIEWRKALALNPDDGLRAAIQTKLDNGLPPVSVPASRPVEYEPPVVTHAPVAARNR
jgi:tetratricopeptide (TPR) repeat protein